MHGYHRLFQWMLSTTDLGMMALPHAWAQSRADQTKQELMQLQNEWTTAMVKGDVGFLEKLSAQELRITAMDGSVADREAGIAKFATQSVKPERIESDQVQVSLYGDVAVVTGRELLKGTYKGKYGEARLRFTNVLVRRDGRWQLVSHHSTQERKKAP